MAPNKIVRNINQSFYILFVEILTCIKDELWKKPYTSKAVILLVNPRAVVEKTLGDQRLEAYLIFFIGGGGGCLGIRRSIWGGGV